MATIGGSGGATYWQIFQDEEKRVFRTQNLDARSEGEIENFIKFFYGKRGKFENGVREEC